MAVVAAKVAKNSYMVALAANVLAIAGDTSGAKDAMTKLVLSKKIAENSLVLPAPTTVVTRVLQLVGDSAFSPKDATTLVERDNVLAARVLRAANSVEQAGVNHVRTLPEALTRLGVEALRSLLIESSAHRLFESRDARIGAHTRGLWEHSLAVAVLSRELAGLCGARRARGRVPRRPAA